MMLSTHGLVIFGPLDCVSSRDGAWCFSRRHALSKHGRPAPNIPIFSPHATVVGETQRFSCHAIIADDKEYRFYYTHKEREKYGKKKRKRHR
jgi:hypothetical protein